MDALQMTLLFDYYGELLTERQRMCFDLRHNQDLSLGEIGEELGISRQGVHDNLSRAEALLREMEAKTGCAGRDQACRKAVSTILDAAGLLGQNGFFIMCLVVAAAFVISMVLYVAYYRMEEMKAFYAAMVPLVTEAVAMLILIVLVKKE